MKEKNIVEALNLCKKADMVKLGTVVLDGAKTAGNALLSANLTNEAPAEEVKKIKIRNYSHSLLMKLFIIGLIFFYSSIFAAGAVYYIDTLGSNSNNGTSAGTAWRNFDSVNIRTFQPDDRILFKRGCVWNQEMTLHGSGTALSWITVDAYGSGNKPKIKRNNMASDMTITISGGDFWSINNLELCNAGMGIVAEYSTLNHEGLKVRNIYAHDMELVWRDFDGPYQESALLNISQIRWPLPKPGAADCHFKNIEISDCRTYRTLPWSLGIFDNYIDWTDHCYKDVVIKNNVFLDFRGAIGLEFTTNAIIIDNVFINGGYAPQSQGTTGIFFWHLKQINVINNFLDTVANTGNNDMSWIDVEGYTDSIRLSNNYVANTAGGAFEWLFLDGRPNAYNTNNSVTGNTFVNIGTGNSFSKGCIYTYVSGGGPFGGIATDNLYQNRSGFAVTAGSGSFSNWTMQNNQAVLPENIYSSLAQFSGTQGENHWTYEYFDGVNWANMSYNSINERWYAGNARLSRCNFLPDDSAAVKISKVWTAPTAGYISIRGRVLKNDISGGDGVEARISCNGAQIWPSGSVPQTVAFDDQSGFDANVNALPVSAGDKIAFEIDGKESCANDLTSWAPCLVFSSDSANTNLALNKPVMVSSFYNAGYSGDKAVDSNVSTFWCAEGEFFPQWLAVDLGLSCALQTIRQRFHDADNSNFKYIIEGSNDNQTWTVLADNSISGRTGQTFTDTISGSYRYVKMSVTGTSNGHWASSDEFEVYGKRGGTDVFESTVREAEAGRRLLVSPNPFNQTLILSVSDWKHGNHLKIYSITGKVVVDLTSRLNSGTVGTGTCQISWNALGIVSGIYFAILTNDKTKYKQKVVLIR